MADSIDLRSINWSHGMFLTPEHFLQQEKYLDSLILWLIRYATDSHGLVGGGPRVDRSERGAARFDPVIDVEDTGDLLKITVSRARGITRGGALIEIDDSRPVQGRFRKDELEGVSELGVYLLALPHRKKPDPDLQDSVNPQLQLARRTDYEIKLDPDAAEMDWALLLTRIRRAEKSLRFARVPGFIPPCTLMSSHSELMHAFRQLHERVAAVADRYGLLHQAIADFIGLARSRGLEVERDQETLEFAGRMVLALEDCAYEALEPHQPPRRFFLQLARLIRNSALFLSLSPPTREYFRLLADFGEAEFVSLLEQEGETLEAERSASIDEDLRLEVERAARGLRRLETLEQALEGKYLDYRLSPSLEKINFLFDRTSGEPVLYKSVAKPARPQAQGQELTFVFAPLRLEARETYRLVLVGDGEARFMPGDRLHAELRINPGEGYSRSPDYKTTDHEIEGQRNFAVDFRAPEDIAAITDLRVSLRAGQPVRSAMLYVRARLMPGAVREPSLQAPPPRQEAQRAEEPAARSSPPARRRLQEPDPHSDQPARPKRRLG